MRPVPRVRAAGLLASALCAAELAAVVAADAVVGQYDHHVHDEQHGDPVTNCDCHGEPAYWQRDVRTSAGGWWECAVKRRQRQRDRYDNDWRHRISKRLHDDSRRRLETIERRRRLGPLQD